MQEPHEERRRFVRHPIQVPVTVHLGDERPELRSQVADLSGGGLGFNAPFPLDAGTELEVVLPVGDRAFRLEARVVRCAPESEPPSTFHVGLAFVNAAASFRMKLAEQVLRIEDLRRELSLERGEVVSNEEAARRWVEQYAAEFAELYA